MKLTHGIRFLNCLYAFFNGYFWLPCPICKKNFGGHEWGASIYRGRGHGEGVCYKQSCIDKAKELSISIDEERTFYYEKYTMERNLK